MSRGRRAAAATLALLAAAALAQDARRSGFEFMGPSTQALQRDDQLNPAFLWVKDGAIGWQQAPGVGIPSCATCHGERAESMRGVAARYPAWSDALGRPATLGQRINQCRERQQFSAPLAAESHELLALEAYVALQSRGLPLAPPADERLAPARQRGEALFQQRLGQLDLSCAHCHAQRAGRRLGASVIPEGHPTGYPTYRLEWQGVGSLQRRLRTCLTGVRAEPFAYGAPEFVALELYLAQRAAGMPMDAPAVRP